jgi:NAD-dependent deacetylase
VSKLYIFSGAGISKESGVPTFREAGGLWEQYNVEEVCYIENFLSNYQEVHTCYNEARSLLKNIEPNIAHKAIASLGDKVVNVTTNVDGLFEKAGCNNVVNLHGSLDKLVYNYGDSCEREVFIGMTEVSQEVLERYYPVKPACIFFGEDAPEYLTLSKILEDITSDDVILIVGSSETVINFTQLTRGLGSKVVVVNPDKGLINSSGVDYIYETACSFFEGNYYKELIKGLD